MQFASPLIAGSERHTMRTSMIPSSKRTRRVATGGSWDHKSRYADAIGSWSEPAEILSENDESLFPVWFV
jgi:hypothetical protein